MHLLNPQRHYNSFILYGSLLSSFIEWKKRWWHVNCAAKEVARSTVISSENLSGRFCHHKPTSLFHSTTYNAMWKPSSWRGLILTFEFFQCISNINFNNSHTHHLLCCMTSRTNLQNPCSPNSSTHRWRQKSRKEKYSQKQRQSLEQERAEEKVFHTPCLRFRLIGRDQITGMENGCFSDL